MNTFRKKTFICLLAISALIGMQTPMQAANPFSWAWRQVHAFVVRPVTISASAIARCAGRMLGIARFAQNHAQAEAAEPEFDVIGSMECVFGDIRVPGRRITVTPNNPEEPIVEVQQVHVVDQHGDEDTDRISAGGNGSCGAQTAKNNIGLFHLLAGNRAEGLRWLQDPAKTFELLHRPIEGLGDELGRSGRWRKKIIDTRTKKLLKTALNNATTIQCLLDAGDVPAEIAVEGDREVAYDGDGYNVAKIRSTYNRVLTHGDGVINRTITEFFRDPMQPAVVINGDWLKNKIREYIRVLPAIPEEEINEYAQAETNNDDIMAYLQSDAAFNQYFNFGQINARPFRLSWQKVVELRAEAEDDNYDMEENGEWLDGEEIQMLHDEEVRQLPDGFRDIPLLKVDQSRMIRQPAFIPGFNADAEYSSYALGDMQQTGERTGLDGHWRSLVLRKIAAAEGRRARSTYTITDSSGNPHLLNDTVMLLPLIRALEGERGAGIVRQLQPPAREGLRQRVIQKAKHFGRRIRAWLPF